MQLNQHLSGLGVISGWLVIFGQQQEMPLIAERTRVDGVRSASDRIIQVVRG